MNAIVASLALLPLLAACTHENRVGTGHSLSHDEISTAKKVVRQEISEQEATLTSAYVVVRLGVVQQPNTGHPCKSGRALSITMIGNFPHIVTGGPEPVPSGAPRPPSTDGTVRSVGITVDAKTGRPCLIGVGTTRAKPPPGARMLAVD